MLLLQKTQDQFLASTSNLELSLIPGAGDLKPSLASVGAKHTQCMYMEAGKAYIYISNYKVNLLIPALGRQR